MLGELKRRKDPPLKGKEQDLLRRHPGQAAHGICRHCGGVGLHELAQAKIRDLAGAIIADEDIWSFHVQVADFVCVQHVESLADVCERLTSPASISNLRV